MASLTLNGVGLNFYAKNAPKSRKKFCSMTYPVQTNAYLFVAYLCVIYLFIFFIDKCELSSYFSPA